MFIVFHFWVYLCYNKELIDNPYRKKVSVWDLQIDVYKRQGETILAPCDLTIHAGEKIAIIGESGAGKTTLLNILYGEIPVSYTHLMNAIPKTFLKKMNSEILLKCGIV